MKLGIEHAACIITQIVHYKDAPHTNRRKNNQNSTLYAGNERMVWKKDQALGWDERRGGMVRKTRWMKYKRKQ